MRRVFIDAGCNNGDSIKAFLEGKVFKVEDPFSFEIYAFDVSDFSSQIEKVFTSQKLAGAFYQKAIWINDGKISFNFTKDNSVTTTADEFSEGHKRLPRLTTDTKYVESVDFSKWIKNNFSPSDYILLKMDIEGSEFRVLPKMIIEGTMRYIKSVRVEFHDRFLLYPRKQREILKPIRKYVINYCKENKIPIRKW